ncbi:MAG TPA: VOC family protein [Acidimicrobiales bacterium]|nr:VOC family protein [Acidimicrobiales bacterium]
MGSDLFHVGLCVADIERSVAFYCDGGARVVQLSFYLDDADAKRAKLAARGDVTITSKVVRLGATMRSFYTTDPDGVPVEILQLTGGATHDSVLADAALGPLT